MRRRWLFSNPVTNSEFSNEKIRKTPLLIWKIISSEPVTAVMVTERTNGLSIKDVWSSISKLFNINKHAKVMVGFI